MKKDALDISMGIYSDSKTIINERKKKFFMEGMEIYNNPKPLSPEDYAKMRTEFNNGNKEVLADLFYSSLAHIIGVTSSIYAKYDIEDVFSFEECLSLVLEKMNKPLKSFRTLPASFKVFVNSTLNYYIFMIINLAYKTESLKVNNETLMQMSDLIWAVDKQESVSLADTELLKEDFNKRLDKIFSLLTSKEVVVIKMRYGLEDGIERKYEEISKVLGVSRARAEQIHKTVMRKIGAEKYTKHLKGYEHGIEN